MAKRYALRLLGRPTVRFLLSPMRRDSAAIFMLHRFRDPERGVEGHDGDGLRRVLAYLRADGVELLPLDALFDRLAGDGPPLNGAVAFTIDDGYYDQARIGAPIFAAYDCPVTTFVSTGFLDAELWFWWDQVDYAFERTARRRFSGEVGGMALSWEDHESRARAGRRFTEHCKRLPDDSKRAATRALASALDVDLPDRPPPEYEPMSWSELRSCENGAMRFAPHTITHPVLSRISDDQAEWEIVGSWRRLKEEASRPVPIFCYPNGQRADYGEREIDILRTMGLRGAVAATPGYAEAAAFRASPHHRFEVPRFLYTPDMADVLQVVTGFERLKRALRREGVG